MDLPSSRRASLGATPRRADPLAALVYLLRPQAVYSKVVSGLGKWSVCFGGHEDPGFCILLEGSCFLEVEGIGIIELKQGDFLLFPRVPAFTMGNDRALAPTLLTEVHHARVVRHGPRSGPITMRQLAGSFQFDRANARLLAQLMPPVVHVRHGETKGGRLSRIVQLIDEEVDADGHGSEPILERLLEVLLIEALRFQPATDPKKAQGLFAGLSDPALARALRSIHLDVKRGWTVAELARIAGLSRSTFAARFARAVGLPPMEYLLEWRMALAKDMLRRERLPLVEVADRIGYQSASAFSTAFTRVVGSSPSVFARR
jgi:AraC-like DNA-binding protein